MERIWDTWPSTSNHVQHTSPSFMGMQRPFENPAGRSPGSRQAKSRCDLSQCQHIITAGHIEVPLGHTFSDCSQPLSAVTCHSVSIHSLEELAAQSLGREAKKGAPGCCLQAHARASFFVMGNGAHAAFNQTHVATGE
eukprot:1150021-Pelagomonas_calceolata.AAC.3